MGLVLEAVNSLTPVWSERSALLALLQREKMRTGQVAEWIREIDGFSYSTASKALCSLTEKGFAHRVFKGMYRVNKTPVVARMMEILEAREEVSVEFGD